MRFHVGFVPLSKFVMDGLIRDGLIQVGARFTVEAEYDPDGVFIGLEITEVESAPADQDPSHPTN